MALNTYSDMEITFTRALVLLVEQIPSQDGRRKNNLQWQWLWLLLSYLYLDQDSDICADDNSKLKTYNQYIFINWIKHEIKAWIILCYTEKNRNKHCEQQLHKFL